MEQLNETQQEILSALDDRGGRGNTSNIKSSIGEMTTSNLGKQARSLVEMGLIEKVGEEDVGAPIPANVYALTAEGERVAHDLDDRTEVRVVVSEEDVADLRHEVSDLSMALSHLHDHVDDLADEQDSEGGDQLSMVVEDLDEAVSRLSSLEKRTSALESEVENHSQALETLNERTIRLREMIDE
ncbi:chromosome segregation protein [Haloferax volcanii]|uniref:chromosome segregation protein n=1 Tax=Haloferax volcanii TaxID=2246 RepID=UPI00385BC3DA